MDEMEIVERIRDVSPGVLGRVSDGRAAAIIRQALAVVADRLAAAPDGAVHVTGLGRFIVKLVEQDKDGELLTARRVIYRGAKGKAPGTSAT